MTSLHRARTADSAASSAAGSRLQPVQSHVHSNYLDDHSVYQDVHHDYDPPDEYVDVEAGGEAGTRQEGEAEKKVEGKNKVEKEYEKRREDKEYGGGREDKEYAENDAEKTAQEELRQRPESGSSASTAFAADADDDGVGEGDDADGRRDLDADVEKLGSRLTKKKSTKSIRDPNIVTWDGPDDPSNPKNWTKRRKWINTLMVSLFTFISPVSSSMVAPALGQISQDLDITSDVEAALVLSIFVLSYAVGPLFLGPASELYGRVTVLQLSNLIYLIFNTACGAARNKGMMIAFRFLAGLGGSAPLAIGGAVLGDSWRPEERGAAIAVYSLMPLIGPSIGPVVAGQLTTNVNWRWLFFVTSIADAAIQLTGLFVLRETYPPKILHDKTKRLRAQTGNAQLRSEFDHPDRKLSKHLSIALSRPFTLLFTQPIVQVLACYQAYLYGLMYIMLTSFPMVFNGIYGQSVSVGSLNYISLGVGFSIGTQVCARLQDVVYRRLKQRNGGVGKPEFRIPLVVPGSLLTVVGLFIYGWSARFRTHWIVPNVGAAIFALGSIMCFQGIQTYIVDTYTRYAASAIAAVVVLRSAGGFGFPLFAPVMYRALGQGWGNSVLGFVGVAIGLPAPLLLWFYGERIRSRSTFSAGGY